ncbi:hypothetical protein Clacol_001299 [Clathrus columnatus]|uniref:Uncharacterized protein n=1 Tax=Clathrus columnatus TaxID=1419009 RepID=A0AAV5A1C5_9AGAM|nr:hypothetical protein Clacol_001299 [Clathrus columnatus]
MTNGTQSDTTTITPTSLYGYIPTRWICITFLALFGVTTVIHLFQALFIKPRKYWIIPTLALCGIGEIIGWSGRLWNSINSVNRNAYLIQDVVKSLIAELADLKIFITIDVVSLVVQAAGGGIASGNSLSAAKLGGDIVLVGIIFQLSQFLSLRLPYLIFTVLWTVALLFFTALAIEVIYRFRSKKPMKRYAPVLVSGGSSLESIPPFMAEKLEFSMPKQRVNLMVIGLSIATFLVIIRTPCKGLEMDSVSKYFIRISDVLFKRLERPLQAR